MQVVPGSSATYSTQSATSTSNSLPVSMTQRGPRPRRRSRVTRRARRSCRRSAQSWRSAQASVRIRSPTRTSRRHDSRCGGCRSCWVRSCAIRISRAPRPVRRPTRARKASSRKPSANTTAPRTPALPQSRMMSGTRSAGTQIATRSTGSGTARIDGWQGRSLICVWFGLTGMTRPANPAVASVCSTRPPARLRSALAPITAMLRGAKNAARPSGRSFGGSHHACRSAWRNALRFSASIAFPRSRIQRFDDLAVQHDALDAALFALPERALRRDADLLHAGLPRRRLDRARPVRRTAPRNRRPAASRRDRSR